jgi:hypothetical protein
MKTQLDVETVLRVTEAVSSEIEFEATLEAIVRAALEYSRATHARLCVRRDGEWRIQADATFGDGGIVAKVRDGTVSEAAHSMLALPLVTRDTLVAMLYLEGDRDSGEFTPEQSPILRVLA